jgi:glycosyltransferase involved in cell wall biosynthesis
VSGHAVIVTRVYSPATAAAAFRLQAVVRELRRTGQAVTVLSAHVDSWQRTRSVGIEGEQIISWPMLGGRGDGIRRMFSVLSFDLLLAFRVSLCILARRPSVIIVEPPPTSGLICAVVGRLARTAVIYYAADLWADMFTGSSRARRGMRGVFRWVERTCLRLSAAVLTVNGALGQRIVSEHSVVPTVVGNGVDLRTYAAPACHRSKVLVYAGTLGVAQGATALVALGLMLEELEPDARLDVYGEGAERAAIESLADELGLSSLRFHGIVENSVVADALGRASAAVVVLKEEDLYRAALPTKIFAALASGAPVIFVGPTGIASTLIQENDLGIAATRATLATLVPWLRSRLDASDSYRELDLRGWAAMNGSLEAVARRVVDACPGEPGDSKEMTR